MKINEIIEESNITQCVFCGKCSGSCPVGKKSRLRVRNLIHDLYMGKDVLYREELWFCTTCYTCVERCPKGVNTVDAILNLRNIAVRLKKYPKIHEMAINSIYDTGSGLPLSDDAIKIRTVIGLEKLPFDVSTNEKDFLKFKELIKDLQLLSFLEED